MTKLLEVIDAHKRFGAVQALDGVSLRLEQSEWLGLLGPNGAGKTTLIRAVMGRVRLDRGTISLEGRILDRSPEARKMIGKIGIVSQEIALYSLLTAAENLEVWGTFYGLSGRELAGRVEWALEWTGLSDRSREKIKGFSTGMKRRLNIACSTLHDPEILLLDEPTVGVDPQSRQRIWEMLRDLNEKKVSLMLTTHQLDEAQQLCDRIVIIDHGRVVADGSFEELVRNTIGPERRVTVSLDQSIPDSLRSEDGFEFPNESTLLCKVGDVAGELPGLLARLSAAGAQIRELTIQPPSLQEIFIHLTGRELRE